MSGTITKINQQFELNIYNSITSLDKEKYNEIVDSENPFLEYEFLEAFEQSGSASDTAYLAR